MKRGQKYGAGIVKPLMVFQVAAKPLATFKHRIRELTRRNGGVSLQTVVSQLRRYLLGWKAYFRLAQTPRVFRNLDQWIRHRLRAILLKQWRRGTTVYRELKALGASRPVALTVAAQSRHWWGTSVGRINKVLTNAYFARLGLPTLA